MAVAIEAHVMLLGVVRWALLVQSVMAPAAAPLKGCNVCPATGTHMLMNVSMDDRCCKKDVETLHMALLHNYVLVWPCCCAMLQYGSAVAHQVPPANEQG